MRSRIWPISAPWAPTASSTSVRRGEDFLFQRPEERVQRVALLILEFRPQPFFDFADTGGHLDVDKPGQVILQIVDALIHRRHHFVAALVQGIDHDFDLGQFRRRGAVDKRQFFMFHGSTTTQLPRSVSSSVRFVHSAERRYARGWSPVSCALGLGRMPWCLSCCPGCSRKRETGSN